MEKRHILLLVAWVYNYCEQARGPLVSVTPLLVSVAPPRPPPSSLTSFSTGLIHRGPLSK